MRIIKVIYTVLVFSSLDSIGGGLKSWQTPCAQNGRPENNHNASDKPLFSRQDIINNLNHFAHSAKVEVQALIAYYKNEFSYPNYAANDTCIYLRPWTHGLSLENRTSLWATYTVIAKYLHYINFTSNLMLVNNTSLKKGCNFQEDRYGRDCIFGCESYDKKHCRRNLQNDFQMILCNLENLADESAVPNRTAKHITVSTRCVRAYVLNTTKGHGECLWLDKKGIPLVKNKSFRKTEKSTHTNLGEESPVLTTIKTNVSEDVDINPNADDNEGKRTKRDLIRLKRGNRFGRPIKLETTSTTQPQSITTRSPDPDLATLPHRIRHQHGRRKNINRKRRCKRICRKNKLSKKERRLRKKCECERESRRKNKNRKIKRKRKHKDSSREDHSETCKLMLDLLILNNRYLDHTIMRYIVKILENIVEATNIEPMVAPLVDRLSPATSVGSSSKPLLTASSFVVSFRHLSDYLNSYFR